MTRWLLALTVVGAALGRAWAAEPQPTTVRDYEARLEEVSREVEAIRRELEGLVEQVAEGETGRVLVFLEGSAPAFREKGVAVTVDGKPVASRALTAAELDAAGRGVPLELVALRLAAGPHQVVLSPLGDPPGEPAEMVVERGKLSSWVAKASEAGLTWRAE